MDKWGHSKFSESVEKVQKKVSMDQDHWGHSSWFDEEPQSRKKSTAKGQAKQNKSQSARWEHDDRDQPSPEPSPGVIKNHASKNDGCPGRNQGNKSRRPDVQVYVPRAKRVQYDPETENLDPDPATVSKSEDFPAQDPEIRSDTPEAQPMETESGKSGRSRRGKPTMEPYIPRARRAEETNDGITSSDPPITSQKDVKNQDSKCEKVDKNVDADVKGQRSDCSKERRRSNKSKSKKSERKEREEKSTEPSDEAGMEGVSPKERRHKHRRRRHKGRTTAQNDGEEDAEWVERSEGKGHKEEDMNSDQVDVKLSSETEGTVQSETSCIADSVSGIETPNVIAVTSEPQSREKEYPNDLSSQDIDCSPSQHEVIDGNVGVSDGMPCAVAPSSPHSHCDNDLADEAVMEYGPVIPQSLVEKTENEPAAGHSETTSHVMDTSCSQILKESEESNSCTSGTYSNNQTLSTDENTQAVYSSQNTKDAHPPDSSIMHGENLKTDIAGHTTQPDDSQDLSANIPSGDGEPSTSMTPTSCSIQDQSGNNKSSQSQAATDSQSELPTQTSIDGETSQSGSFMEEDEDSWDKMYDDTGEALDPKLLEELASAVGEVEIQKPQFDYYSYQPKDVDLDYDSYGHLLEIYDFPSTLQTRDLIVAFKEFGDSGFDLKWVDDNHAIGIFSSNFAARSALTLSHPMIKVRPLSQATRQTKVKAKRTCEFLQPYKARPETVASVARNMVAGALGIRSNVPREKREEERRKLRDAKEKKRQASRLKKDAWDGSFGNNCAMDAC